MFKMQGETFNESYREGNANFLGLWCKTAVTYANVGECKTKIITCYKTKNQSKPATLN